MLKELKFQKCVFEAFGRGLDFLFPAHLAVCLCTCPQLLSWQEAGDGPPQALSPVTVLSDNSDLSPS